MDEDNKFTEWVKEDITKWSVDELKPLLLTSSNSGLREQSTSLFIRRGGAYASTSTIASHYNYEKMNSWVSFVFLYVYRAPLGGP